MELHKIKEGDNIIHFTKYGGIVLIQIKTIRQRIFLNNYYDIISTNNVEYSIMEYDDDFIYFKINEKQKTFWKNYINQTKKPM